jgi:hypothetical protein
MKKIPLLVSGICMSALILEAQTTIDDSTDVYGTWTKVNSPYLINGLATVPAGNTLIIEPGVEIRFKTGIDYNYSDNKGDVGLLYVKGKLIAEGTSSQRITFTRQGNSGNWGCIALEPTTDVSSSLKYCKVEYANAIMWLQSLNYEGAISVRNSTATIANSEIISNNRNGIDCTTSTPLIQSCVIANNQQYGINLIKAFRSDDTIVVTNNTITGNGSSALRSTARCKIVNNILWNNKESFYLYANTSVASYNLVQEDNIIETDLLIGEGMIYNCDPRLEPDFSPQYNSTVINAGTPDTTGLHLSGNDFWGNIRINHGRIDIGAVESDALEFICLLSPNGKEGFLPGTTYDIKWKSNADNVKLEYTINDGFTWNDIVASTPNDSIYNWNIPSVESSGCNIRISDVTDNTIFDLCDDNFVIFTSNIPDNTNLSGRLTIEYSPYYINGMVTVPLGDILIIDPGVEIRFKTGANLSLAGRLYINGTMIAEGTSSQRITFTRQGNTGNWGSVSFAATADTSSSLKYCKIEFADRASGAVSIRNPKVSISHSEIISNNKSGIYCQYSNPLIENCIIANNQNNGVTSEGSTPLVKNCLIVKNGKDGINIWSAFNSKDTIFITNNTIAGNGLTGLYDNYTKCKIVNNIFWNNKESINKYYLSQYFLSYNLVQEDEIAASSVNIGAGMIYNLDPQFTDIYNNDYHLKATSPCIDAGDPNYAYNLEPYDNGGRINIGAYGNTPEATKTEYLPRINFLSVKEGRMFGKDTLTIKGVNFLSSRGSGTIKFGSAESLEYLYWSEDSIICITPPHLPEIVDINIVNNDAKIGLGKNCFSFLPPVLNEPDPIFSNTSGGQQIIFSGELFGHSQNGVQVLFGQIESPLYQTWNDTSIELNCPAHPEGLVDLLFRLNDSIYYNFSESFLYSDKPLTELCGEISDTLYNSQNYILTCPVIIPENQTLVIEPGVLIIAQYDEDTLISITSNGVIKADGSKSDTIKMISLRPYKSSWEGITVKNQSSFDYCIIKNGINAISVQGGNLELKNSIISNNSNAGLELVGTKGHNTIENTSLYDNKYGIYTLAKPGSVSATFSSCNIFDNNESGIYLYSYAYASGFIVPVYGSSPINITLKNSVVSNNGSNAIKIRSYGDVDYGYSPPAHRYGYVNLISENNIIHDNVNGIAAHRENTTHCTVYTKFYNTVMYNNNSVIEMDVNQVFMYNSNLWDNGISGNPVGICDSLVVEHSNLNSLENIPYGTDNISSNPNYISPGSGDFHLSQGSPCIDAGSNQFVSFETDFDDKVRIWNATDKDSAIVDIGAFEFGTPCYADTIEKEICEGESYESYTESGVYQFKHTNVSGCDSVILVNLHVNPVPVKPIIVQNLDTLTSNAETGNQWYLNNNPITAANNQKYIVAADGDYHVVITNDFGCVSSPSDIITIVYSSLENLKECRPEVYPNPASEFIIVAGLIVSEEVEIGIYNMNGICIKKEITSSKEVRINIKELKPGSYTLILNNLSKQGTFRYYIQKI